MKKIIIVLMMFFTVPAFADVVGTGWVDSICKHTATTKPCKKPKYNYLGIKADLGFPDGLGLSFIGRPLNFLQAELGATTTLSGGGVRAGIMIFLPWYISPGLAIEGGKNWAGDVNKILPLFGGSSPNIALLKDVEYEYIDLLGSLGLGSPQHFYFRISAGYSYITGHTNGFQAFIREQTKSTSITTSEVSGKVFVPTAKLSLTVYF